jgi:nucleoside-diphosphate-sugar epimerase
VNVSGVLEVLQLAAEGRPKRLVHLSTSGVLPTAPGLALDADGPSSLQAIVPADGYHRSRWVAEQLVNHARERGIPSTVIRLGGVMAASDTGEGDEAAPLTVLLQTCADIGLRIAGPAVTDWTPVDTASGLLVDALAGDVLPQGTVHVVRPGIVRLDDVLDRLGQFVPLRRVDYATFWAAVAVQAASDAGASRLLALLPTPHEARPERLPGLFGDAHGLRVSTSGAALTARLGLAWPDIDGGVVDAHVRWALSPEG